MSILLATLLLAASEPATAAQPTQEPPVVVKKKPRQVCEYIEITGSRSRKRVCRNADGELDLTGHGVSSSFGAQRSKESRSPAAIPTP
ncbi:MAG TPA: hypothetical protein VFU87_03100 [Sphingomicrobium sp.]|jgi:hypothetical protein|nr:hypothetical protein [Sphingomicrobium sp.]